ncbi:response regulator [Myxococcota bacterium]|nr:response regulator [Myxococcota bacterium]
MRILIADDELLARKRLHRLIAALPEHELVGEAQDGAEVLAAIAAQPVDVVLLDIAMPGLSGVEAMQLWPPDGPAIVFTTAHAEHAVAAFEGGAVDYVLKPVEAGRLRQALERVAARRAAPAPGPPRLALATRKGVVLLDPAEIRCCRIDGASVQVQAARGDFWTELSLADLEARLPATFRRLHRQALVNMDQVERLEDNGFGGYTAHLCGGGTVSVSRQVARALRREWGL